MNDCSKIVPIRKAKRAPGEARPSKLRSAVTNGTRLFVDGAHEGPWARRFRDLVQLHEEDLGPHETLSELQRSLCRRVATLEVELEQMEGKLSKGEEVDLELYRALTGTLSRVGTSLGVKRVAKPSGPKSVAEYAAMKRGTTP